MARGERSVVMLWSYLYLTERTLRRGYDKMSNQSDHDFYSQTALDYGNCLASSAGSIPGCLRIGSGGPNPDIARGRPPLSDASSRQRSSVNQYRYTRPAQEGILDVACVQLHALAGRTSVLDLH